MSRPAARLLLLPSAIIFAAFLGACGAGADLLPTAPRDGRPLRGNNAQADSTRSPGGSRDSTVTTQGNYENPLV